MIDIRSLLDRFRRAGGAPGAPAAAGAVPPDPESQLRAELRPLLLAIDDIEDEADAIRTAGEATAQSALAAADNEVGRVATTALVEAGRVRREATATERAHDRDNAQAIVAAATVEAGRVRRRARRRTDRLVAKVLECAWELPQPLEVGRDVAGLDGG